MPNKLIRSNRNSNTDALKPIKKAKATDFDKTTSTSIQQTNEITSVSFYTNLRISNHIRNKLQSLVILGHAESQIKAVDLACSTFIESLTPNEQKEIELQIETLEKRDVKQHR